MTGVSGDGTASLGVTASVGDLQLDDQRHDSTVHVPLYRTPSTTAAAKRPLLQVRQVHTALSCVVVSVEIPSSWFPRCWCTYALGSSFFACGTDSGSLICLCCAALLERQVALVQRTRSGGTVIDDASILLQELNVETEVDFLKCLATVGMRTVVLDAWSWGPAGCHCFPRKATPPMTDTLFSASLIYPCASRSTPPPHLPHPEQLCRT